MKRTLLDSIEYIRFIAVKLVLITCQSMFTYYFPPAPQRESGVKSEPMCTENERFLYLLNQEEFRIGIELLQADIVEAIPTSLTQRGYWHNSCNISLRYLSGIHS